MRNKHALAADAIHVEQNVIGEAVGSQDQVSAAYGGFNRINFNTDGSFQVKPIIASPDRLAHLQDHLRSISQGLRVPLLKSQRNRSRRPPQERNELETMFQMVGEAEEIVTNPNRSLDEFGHLLHECWKVKRTLTGSITNSNLDEIYEAGRSAGALGGKILGAGGGGFMLFFVPPERRKELRTRLKNLLCVPFGFSNRGSHVVVYEPEEMYDESLTTERYEVYAQQLNK